jgi:aerobic carbon-monoxide dehydrogenase large subunit
VSILGNRVPRLEDPELLTRGGTYVDDLATEPLLTGALFVHYVRSTMAHAMISVDATPAQAFPGVVAVITGADLATIDPGFRPVPVDSPAIPKGAVRPWLATERVRYVGEAVVAIVAESKSAGADAAELVIVDYDPLPAVVDPELAQLDETLLFPDLGTNIVFTLKREGDLEEADFTECDAVVELRIVNQRVAPCPIEPRAAAAVWVGDRLHYWCSSQGIHPIRDVLARIYNIDKSAIRGVTPHVGGGFGAKATPYPEELLLPFLSRIVKRPVRWVSNRSEDMVNLGHGRAQVQYVRMGGLKSGHIRAYEMKILGDAGAYPRFGAVLPTLTKLMQTGCYNIAKQSFESTSVVTNTTPVVAYRGAGRPEAAAALERIVDRFAQEIGMDPAEVRRINALPPEAFPVTTKTKATYDSGSYAESLSRALKQSGYEQLRAEQQARRGRGDRIMMGIGMSMYVEVTGAGGSPEYARVDVLSNGKVRALTGTSPHGQGHHTSWAMLISDQLGVPMSDIELVFGDSDIVPTGGITGGSRSLQTGGVAMYQAARVVHERAKELAADLLEAAPEDIRRDADHDGFYVAGSPTSSVSWQRVVNAAYAAPLTAGGSDQTADVAGSGAAESTLVDASGADGAGAAAGAFVSTEALGPLGFEHTWGSGQATFPSGAHVAVVDVDLDTGLVRLQRFVAVDDAGRILNPLIAEGQVHGGLAQGIAQALMEEFRYDEVGNPLTSNFADYAVISAAELPSFEIGHLETPTPTNELGAKGIGESGTIGSTPAVQNAVIDALSHLGVSHIDMPLTPERVWKSLQSAQSKPR